MDIITFNSVCPFFFLLFLYCLLFFATHYPAVTTAALTTVAPGESRSGAVASCHSHYSFHDDHFLLTVREASLTKTSSHVLLSNGKECRYYYSIDNCRIEQNRFFSVSNEEEVLAVSLSDDLLAIATEKEILVYIVLLPLPPIELYQPNLLHRIPTASISQETTPLSSSSADIPTTTSSIRVEGIALSYSSGSRNSHTNDKKHLLATWAVGRLSVYHITNDSFLLTTFYEFPRHLIEDDHGEKKVLTKLVFINNEDNHNNHTDNDDDDLSTLKLLLGFEEEVFVVTMSDEESNWQVTRTTIFSVPRRVKWTSLIYSNDMVFGTERERGGIWLLSSNTQRFYPSTFGDIVLYNLDHVLVIDRVNGFFKLWKNQQEQNHPVTVLLLGSLPSTTTKANKRKNRQMREVMTLTEEEADYTESLCFAQHYRLGSPSSSFSIYRKKCVVASNQFISHSPTLAPIGQPTFSPTFAPVLCPPFNVSNTNSSTNENTDVNCTFSACVGDHFRVSNCPNCDGDTFLRVLKSSTGEEVGQSDNDCPESLCSMFYYTVPPYDGPDNINCFDYVIWAGCASDTSCSGQYTVAMLPEYPEGN
eukprot:scaffold1287_cov253-Ochromonas_danica.AAC.23